MADVTITAASVKYGTLARASDLLHSLTAGEAIAHGQVVYLDSADGKYYLADNATSEAVANVAGIAITPAATDGPFSMLVKGPFYGGTFTAGKAYELSSTSGAIAQAGDSGSGDWATGLGVASSTTVLEFNVTASGGQVA